MARTIGFEQDIINTGLLDIEDVIAVYHEDTDDDNIYALLDDREIPTCQKCGNRMNNHDLKTKVLLDVVEDGEEKHRFIKLHYIFTRYRCTTIGCHNVIIKPIQFADLKAHTTYRAEAYIVQLAMTFSYRKIEKMVAWNVSEEWEERYSDIVLEPKDKWITAQGIGEVVKRWVANKDAERIFATPYVLGMRTCDSGIGNYIIAYNAAKIEKPEDDDVYIIEVVKDVSVRSLEKFFSFLDISKVAYVLVDFNQTVIDVVRQSLPDATILISTDAVLENLIEDFKYYLNMHMKQLAVDLKEAMLGDPGLISPKIEAEMKRKFEKYAELNNAYHFVEDLWNLIMNETSVEGLQNWGTEMSVTCRDLFPLTAEYIETYWNEIYNFYMRREMVEGEAYEKLKRLDEAMNIFKNFSSDILRARILYLGTQRGKRKVWKGRKYGEIIEDIEKSPKEQRRVKYHE